VLRDRVEGSAIKTKKQQVCHAGEFLVAEIDAKMGGYGVVPKDLHGAIVSSHYFLYQIDESRLLSSYLDWCSKTPEFFAQVSARGSTNYAAIRPDAVLNYTIPLPSLDEQHAIVRRLNEASRGVREVAELTLGMTHELHTLIFRLHEDLSVRELVEFGECLELDERQVAVEPDDEYPQLGIRSFGNGLFFKEAVKGSETSYRHFNQVYHGAMIVSQPKGWEGAVAIATSDHEGWFVSPEYRTFRCNEERLDPSYLAALIVTPWFQHQLSKMTKGQGARRERLRPEMLTSFKLRMPDLKCQKRALEIINEAKQAAVIALTRMKDTRALIPAMLHDIFEGRIDKPGMATSFATGVSSGLLGTDFATDTALKEAILVGAIVGAFHADGNQPLGNFRVQKAVYFARRHMGDTALDTHYLRKAAGPYNPSMRYSGGIKVATDRNWIERATGKFGEGSRPGAAAANLKEWIGKYQLEQTVAWVRDTFKFRSNDIWETLATIDYSILALKHAGIAPTPAAILAYIENDDEWRPKLEKLKLSEASIKQAIVEIESLFPN
jgi:hypothetical protein